MTVSNAALPGSSELMMARAAVRVGLVVVVPIVAAAALLRGTPGALTALGAVAMVVGNLYVTGRSLHWAAGISPVVLQGVALGGFLARLVVYAAAIVLLRPVDAIDGPVLAISAAVAMVLVLGYEVRLVSTHRELWFVDTEARGSASERERA